MTNEAVIIEKLGSPTGRGIRYTIADGVAIAKGTLCTLTDPKTAIKSLYKGEYFAGIANTEKVASDGQTTLGLDTEGIYGLRFDGSTALSAGQLVVLSGANVVCLADDDIAENQGLIVGKALEDAAVGTAKTVQILVGAR